MKISKDDRYMALIRIPEYQRDYKILEKFKEQGKTDLYFLQFTEIKRKWNVVKPPPIKRFNEQTVKKIPPVIFKDESAITIIDNPADLLFDIEKQEVSQEVLDDIELSSIREKYQPIEIKRKYFYDPNNPKDSLKLCKQYSSFSPSKIAKMKKEGTDLSYQGGKHLCMIVDLTKGKTELLKKFKDLVDWYQQKILPKSYERNKETVLDIWEIYDLHNNIDSLNFSQMAKKLSGINENPSHNEVVMSYYRKVERAYNKAIRIIEQVTKETKKTK